MFLDIEMSKAKGAKARQIEYSVKDFNPFDPRHLKDQESKGKKVIVERPKSEDSLDWTTTEISSEEQSSEGQSQARGGYPT
jgi:hypothetical protein